MLVLALRDGVSPAPGAPAFDPDLVETDLAVDRLIAGMAGTADVLLLLTGFHGLLPEQALKLVHLRLQRPVLGRGHHFLASTGRG